MPTYMKITKATARKMYESKKNVYLIPNKTYIGNAWVQPIMINSENVKDFDSAVIAFEVYNCNSELGKSAAFYKFVE